MLTIWFLSLLFAGPAAPRPQATFHFAPPLEKPFRQTVRITSTTHIDLKPAVPKITTVTSRMVFHRAGDAGVILESRSDNATHTENGADVPDPLAIARKDLTLRYSIDPTGHADSISGYDEYIKRLSQLYSDRSWAILSKQLNEEVLSRLDVDEWNGSIADLAGAKVNVGDSWQKVATTTSGNGTPVEYSVTVRVVSQEACGKATCLHLTFDSATDPDKSGGILNTTSGEIVIEPATMLPHKLVSHEVVHAKVQDHEGRSHQLDRDELKETTFEYDAK